MEREEEKRLSPQVISLMRSFRDQDSKGLTHHTTEKSRTILALFLLSIRNENTRNGYFRDVVLFLSFCKNIKKTSIPQITSYDLDLFVELLERGGLSGRRLKASSIARVLAAISSFYQFMYRRKLVKENPVSLVSRKKAEKPHTETFSRPVLEWVLENILNDVKGSQHRAIFLILASTSMRVTELTSLKNSDFNKRSGTIVYTAQKSNIVLKKKLTDKVLNAISEHHRQREIMLKENGLDLMRGDSEPLISSIMSLYKPKIVSGVAKKRNKFVDRRTVNNFIKLYFDRARDAGFDVPDKISSHSFRRYFATSALQAKDEYGSRLYDLAEVAQFLGHSGHGGLSAIQAYDKRPVGDSKSVAERLGF